MRKNKPIVLATVLFMSVGFAAVTSSLYFNGRLAIGTNNQDFNDNIVFSDATTDEDSVAAISTDGKSIDVFTRNIKTLGEEVTIDFVVENKSMQYDANATIKCDYANEDNRFNDYANITISPAEFRVESQEKVNGKLKIRLVKSFIGTDSDNSAQIEFKCRVDASAMERNGW